MGRETGLNRTNRADRTDRTNRERWKLLIHDKMEAGRYYYRIRGTRYEICRDGQHALGERDYYKREEARRRVHELNGWEKP